MTLAIGVLALAPVLTTNFIGLHDRYLYLPSFSFSLAVAAVICHLRMKTAGWTRGLRGLLAALIVVALGGSLIGQERVWESDISLFTRAVEVDPEPRTISRLAAVYGDQDHGKGVRILLDGVARFPHSVLLQQEAGIYYYSQKQPDEAAAHLRIAVAEAGNSSIRARSLCYLGMIDSSKGDRLQAEAELREALRLSPAQPECQRALNALESQAR
jgi:tetratricopeptide (TPR) repeat protein